MKTVIGVVNGVVTVTNEEYPEINKQYDYSSAWALSAVEITRDLVGLTCLNTKDPEAIKEAYRKAGNILGVSVAQYVKQVKGAANRAYIDAVNPLIRRFCLRHLPVAGGKHSKCTIDPIMVDLVNNSADILREYIRDGNEHLAAFGLLVGNANVAATTLGKDLWRRLCKNSKTRNDKICLAVCKCVIKEDTPDSLKAKIEHFLSTPTTMLQRLNNETLVISCSVATMWEIEALLPKIMKHLGGPMCKVKSSKVHNLLTTINDTANMRDRFNPNWSIKRMLSEHAAGVRDLMAKTYSKALFNSVNFFTRRYDYKGCTAELLTSAWAIGVHGKEQGHCVGGYAELVAGGIYSIYRLTDAEGTVSTLGIANPADYYFCCVDQHRLAFNAEVTNENVLELAKMVKSDVLRIMKEHPEIMTGMPMSLRLIDAGF